MQCVVCGTSFNPYRPTQQFCSGACRVKAHRAKHAGKPVTAAVTPSAQEPAPEPIQQGGVTPDVTALSDEELLAEVQRRLDAEASGLLETAGVVCDGSSVAYKQLSKSQVAIYKRFNRDHERFFELVRLGFTVAAREWAAAAHLEEANRLNERFARLYKAEQELDRQRESLSGAELQSMVYDLTGPDLKKLRSFLHPDKHALCGNAKRGSELTIILEALMAEATRVVKLREGLAADKARRSEAAKKAAETRKRNAS